MGRFGTYLASDVELLLKDITGLEEPLPAEVREARIQAGESYANMLPVEYEPSGEYMAAFRAAMSSCAGDVADAVGRLAVQLARAKAGGPVLVSLARAGTPVGILLKRYMSRFLQVDAPHYSISIIRGLGIDRNAMASVLSRHGAGGIVFVDGWTGKGAIAGQLEEAMGDYPGVDPGLAVLSDPAGVARWAGTRDDLLIPSSCLNSTVSGLLSRTFYRPDLIGPSDYHGAAFYGSLERHDVTYDFIGGVEAEFREPGEIPPAGGPERPDGRREAEEIRAAFGIRDVNFVKPGIGEATRVLLRRVPWKVLVRDPADSGLRHLTALAREKGVPVEVYPLRNYRACGLIRDLADT